MSESDISPLFLLRPPSLVMKGDSLMIEAGVGVERTGRRVKLKTEIVNSKSSTNLKNTWSNLAT